MALYLTKQEFQVRAGSAARFEAFADALFGVMEKQGGILRADNLNSLGYPTKYAILALWESRDDARAFGRSSRLTQLLAETSPQEIATPLTSIEAFEVVHRVGGGGPAKVGYVIDQKAEGDSRAVQAYEAARLKLFELRKQHGQGFAFNVLARWLGGGNRYLVVGAFSDAESEAATAAKSELLQYWKDYGPASIPISLESREPYEFVKVAGSKPLPEE